MSTSVTAHKRRKGLNRPDGNMNTSETAHKRREAHSRRHSTGLTMLQRPSQGTVFPAAQFKLPAQYGVTRTARAVVIYGSGIPGLYIAVLC